MEYKQLELFPLDQHHLPSKRQILMLADEIWGEEYEPEQVVSFSRELISLYDNLKNEQNIHT